MTPIMLGADR